MANKQALRDLQTRLAERLQQVRVEQRGQSWLAVDTGGHDMLVPLQHAGEIFDPSTVVPVPHTQPWMSGVVNLRGGVFTVVDLAQFLGVRASDDAVRREGARLLSFNATLGVNVALLVDRLLGLRHAADMQPDDESNDNLARPAFAAARWRDAAGRTWQEISLTELALTPEFLAIGA